MIRAVNIIMRNEKHAPKSLELMETWEKVTPVASSWCEIKRWSQGGSYRIDK